MTEQITVYHEEAGEFKPSVRPSNPKLEYKFAAGEEKHLHSYFMQVKPLQQAVYSQGLKETEKVRYLENVHGYFALSYFYPTKIIMCNSWDSSTVQDEQVF